MMTKMFTNVLTSEAPVTKYEKFLKNPMNLLKWDPEIINIVSNTGGYSIERNKNALNKSELLTLLEEDSAIVYKVAGDRISYKVMFALVTSNQETEIRQTLYLDDDNSLHLPFVLLKPIAKHAFLENLIRMGAIVENAI
ncbi:hypothetical protein BAU15_07170 [Enterococcus sp. JM4C]|uniref:SRPBCC family protein n=1 Tax=Candidatus Enterococcus huntleyi TaxID=1857217 RepID=UPI00137AD493|nr:SRPBCC family protein [Enterococcus sp. JM4C]KAF1297489.1 hypothetical protein BAU15_07170 [Enterococcus sp. JM4C]